MNVGRVMENAFKRSILRQIKTKRDEVVIGAGIGVDCAVFSFENGNSQRGNDTSVMLSCVQEGNPPVKNILYRCANILASRGAETVAVALSILMPVDAEEEMLRGIMAEAEQTCSSLGIQIAQAQSRVIQSKEGPFVTAAAYGRIGKAMDKYVRECGYYTTSNVSSGQDIVVSKWIGLEGTAIIAKHGGDEILAHYPEWLVETAAGFDKYLSTIPEAETAIKSGACALYNISERGIFAALWELAEGAGVGLTIDLKKIPIRQETVEICNFYNINPYELLSGGSLLITCNDGAALTAALEAEGIPAAIIGKITDSNDRLIINEDEKRYLDRPQYGDGILDINKI